MCFPAYVLYDSISTYLSAAIGKQMNTRKIQGKDKIIL